jgi:hypothetical protein
MFSPYHPNVMNMLLQLFCQAGIPWSLDLQDKYQLPLVPHPSIERDQPASVGCGQKKRLVVAYCSLVG